MKFALSTLAVLFSFAATAHAGGEVCGEFRKVPGRFGTVEFRFSPTGSSWFWDTQVLIPLSTELEETLSSLESGRLICVRGNYADKAQAAYISFFVLSARLN